MKAEYIINMIRAVENILNVRPFTVGPQGPMDLGTALHKLNFACIELRIHSGLGDVEVEIEAEDMTPQTITKVRSMISDLTAELKEDNDAHS